MHDLERLGLDDVLRQAIDRVGHRPCFLSVDIDALDPAFGPGTGTPEPGGMSSSDLLRAARMIAGAVDLVGAEIVEVIPTAIGSADVTAVTADRIVREMLTGIALRRQTDNQGRVRPRTTVTQPDQPKL
jgi:agmatinase